MVHHGAMPWQELADLPFAAALRAHRGRLQPRGDYDCEHFDKAAFDDASAPDSRFLECAFTGVSFNGGGLRQARFSSAWLRDAAFTGTSLAETEWADTTLISTAWAGVEAFGARLHRSDPARMQARLGELPGRRTDRGGLRQLPAS